MKRSVYINILLALLLTSCGFNEDEFLPVTDSSANAVEIVARIVPFQDVTVATRTPKDADESEPKTMMMVVFNSDNECVLCRRSHSGESIFAIDRGKDESTGDFVGKDQEKLKKCNIYLIANFPEVFNETKLDVGQTIDEFTAEVNAVTGVTMPEHGLPMLGSYNDVDLSRTSTIGAGKPLSVEMQSLYAKISFDISVEANETLPYTPQFRLDSWELHNLVESVDFYSGTESAPGKNDGSSDSTPLILESGEPKVFYGRPDGNTTAIHGQGNSHIDFSFYLPERFLKATTAADVYDYPFKEGNTIREEDKKLMQRYKPCLADEKATFVRLKGVYKSHQDHSFDVVYDIYLGGDNYGNFDIVRNRLYSNTITIKGITNSQHQLGTGDVSIDHRVDIQHAKPIVIQLRRETMLDSHFEVRPMRLFANEDYNDGVADNMAVKVEVMNVDGTTNNRPSWLRLERSYGGGSVNSSLYCTEGSAAGKRKYFTENLVSGVGSGTNSLSSSTSVIIPVSDISSSVNNCVWIYADECTPENNTPAKNAVRSAKVRVTYGTLNGSTFTPLNDEDLKDVDYVINQALLYPVATTRKEWTSSSSFTKDYTYYIESQEEYLYNFDSEDTFDSNPVFDNGMEWGLNNKQLSHQHNASNPSVQSQGGILGILDRIGLSISDLAKDAFDELPERPLYDFYLSRDTDNSSLTIHDFRGYDFFTEIVDFIQQKYPNDDDAKLDYITLNELPKSAIAYCYNKNKRNESGQVNDIKWYLASIDEIEDIVETDYLAFDGVFQENLYWSCQPAYELRSLNMPVNSTWGDGSIAGDFYVDDLDRARATKVYYKGTDSNGNSINEPASSSVPGYSGVQNAQANQSWFSSPTVTMGTYVSNGELDYKDHEGNLSRTGSNGMARVRCVYKP